jgi:uncharacterized protein
MGVAGDLRVRHRGAEARLEVAPEEFDRVRDRRGDIGARLQALGFARVTLDLAGYRRGSLLRRDLGNVELLAEAAAP